MHTGTETGTSAGTDAGTDAGTVVLNLDEVDQRRVWLAAVRASVEHELAALDELHRLLADPAPPAPPAPPRPSPGDRHGLSAREVTVLGLVAEGCSNRDIGERLHISQNTAANHVRAILAKTGSTNRAGAVTFAARHGLLGER